ncbi:hypothetical protein GGR52DRAFT_580420 [Hypoxylon sp. FL1284]|nr:hypothetical protein GGR52DRAFT_580420 [Hypoxylon sp. FL1284]
MLEKDELDLLLALSATAEAAFIQVPFTNQPDDHIFTDIDGPWPTIPIQYNDSDSRNRPLNAYITFSNASLLVGPQTCADDVTNGTFLCGEFAYPDFYLGRRTGSPVVMNASKKIESFPFIDGIIPTNHTGLEISYFMSLSGNFTGQTVQSSIGDAVVQTSAIVAENLTTFLTNTSRPVPLLNSIISIPGYSAKLLESGATSSQFSSFHTGSISPTVNGSLIIGGYDNNRIMGDLMNWSTTYDQYGRPGGYITLTHINIGVESGFLPLESFKLINGSYPQGPYKLEPSYLVTQRSGAVDGELLVEPGSPYLHLATENCDNLAAVLNLTYDTTRNLYLWSYPSDHPVFQSPVYLELVLTPLTYWDLDTYQNELYPKVSVKIPMALLQHTFHATTRAMNETLIPPARYFPCARQNFEFDRGYRTFPRLGRAFLQAAFIGSNFQYRDGNFTTAEFWLAQAPGPSVIEDGGEDIVEVSSGSIPNRTNVALDANAWTNSWSSVLPIWTLDSDGKTTLGQRNAVSEGKDWGDQLAIEVAVPIAGTIFAGVVLFFSIRGIMHSRATTKRIEKEIAEEDATARQIERLAVQEKELQPMPRDSADEVRASRRGSTVSSLSEDDTRGSPNEEVSLLEMDAVSVIRD